MITSLASIIDLRLISQCLAISLYTWILIKLPVRRANVVFMLGVGTLKTRRLKYDSYSIEEIRDLCVERQVLSRKSRRTLSTLASLYRSIVGYLKGFRSMTFRTERCALSAIMMDDLIALPQHVMQYTIRDWHKA